MRVLHIMSGVGGGISSFVKYLAKGNTSNIIVIDVIGFNEFPEEYESIIKAQGGKCYRLYSLRKHPWKMLRRYCKILKQGDYDALHCHFFGIRSFVFKLIARCLAVKQIMTHAHCSSDGRLGQIGERISCIGSRALSTDYLACSKVAAEFVFGGMNIRGKHVWILPNSVDSEVFIKQMEPSQYQLYRKQLKLKADELVIGHIGRFCVEKNHRFLLAIAKRMKQKHIKFQLFLVGDGFLRDEIQRIIVEESLEDYVNMLGVRDDIPSLMKIFDVLLLPSLSEGLPVTVVEAQASGLPCLISDTITQDSDLGMGLVQFLGIESIDKWVDTITAIKPNEIDESERLRQLEEHGFTMEEMQRKYLHILHQV